MNLTLHLVAKDVRHLRRALILWIGLLVAHVLLGYRIVSTGNFNWDWFQRMGIFSGVLMSFGLVVTYLLIGLLVLEDPVSGESMFWVTRPIKGGRLLAAKVIAALILFGALPIVVHLPWWILCDFSFPDMAVAAVQLSALQLLVAIPAFAVASVSANIGRFLIMSVLLAMGVAVVQIYLWGAEVSWALRMTREWVALIVFGVTGLVGTILMYRTRRIGRVMIFFGIGLGLAGLAGIKFPLELSNPLARHTQVGVLVNSSAIEVRLNPVRLEIPRNKEKSLDDYLVVDMRVIKLPETLGVNTGKADLTLQWPDGTTIRSASVLRSSAQNDSLPLYPAFGLTGRGFRWHWDAETAEKIARSNEDMFERISTKGIPIQRRDPTDTGRSVYLSGSFPISEEIAERILKEVPSYRMTVKVETGVPEVLGEIPLESGYVVTRHGRIELSNFMPGPQSETKAARNARRFNGTFSVLQGPGTPATVVFCYLDRQHQEVGRMIFDQTPPLSTMVERITWVGFPFDAPRIWRTDRWIEVPEWQKDLRIGLVTFKPAGTFDRTVEGERLVVVTHDKTIPITQAESTAN